MLITDDIVSNSLQDVKVRFKELVIPKVITKDLIVSYIRKALRSRVWFSLSPYQRALLKALTHSRVYVIRSRVLKELVTELLIIIERSVLRGKALWYGLLIALSKCSDLVSNWLSSINSLLYLGINYLSNPPIFRPYS